MLLQPNSNTEIPFFIEKASFNDISAIAEMNGKYLIAHLEKGKASNGFIRIEYSSKQIEQLIHEDEIVIAKKEKKLIGYYLVGKRTYNPALHYQAEEAKGWADRMEVAFEKIGFGCQVCIEENYKNNGLFAGMLKELRRNVKDKYTYLLCSISDYNISSLKAHLDKGWKQLDYSESTRFFIYEV